MKKLIRVISVFALLAAVLSLVCLANEASVITDAQESDGKIIINAAYSSTFEDEFVSAAIYNKSGRLVDYFMVPSIPGRDSASIVIDDTMGAAFVKVFVMADKYSFEPVAEAEKVQIEREVEASYAKSYAIIGESNYQMNFFHPKTGKKERYTYVYFPETEEIDIVPYNRYTEHYPEPELHPHLYTNSIVTYEVDENGIYTFTNIGNVWTDMQAAMDMDFESESYIGINRDISVLENETDDSLEVYVDMEYRLENDMNYVTDGYFSKNDDGTFRFCCEGSWEKEICNFIIDENTVIIIAEDMNVNGEWGYKYRQITAEQLENASLSGHFMEAKYIIRNNPDSTENEYLSYFFALANDVELVYEIIENPVRIVAESNIVEKDNGMYAVEYKLNNPYTGAVETAYGKDEQPDKYMLNYEKHGYHVVMNSGGFVEMSDDIMLEEVYLHSYDAQTGELKYSYDETGENVKSVMIGDARIWRMGDRASDYKTGCAKALTEVTAQQLASKDHSLYSCNTEFASSVDAKNVKVYLYFDMNIEDENNIVTDFVVVPVSNNCDPFECDYEMDGKDKRIIKSVDVKIAEVATEETATGDTETIYWYRAYYDFIDPYTGNIMLDAGVEFDMRLSADEAEFRTIGEVVYTNKAGAVLNNSDRDIVADDKVMWMTGFNPETGELSCTGYGSSADDETEWMTYQTDSETTVIVIGNHSQKNVYDSIRWGAIKASSLDKLANPDKTLLARSAPYFDESDNIKYHYGKYPKIIVLTRINEDATSIEKIADCIIVVANSSEAEEYCNID